MAKKGRPKKQFCPKGHDTFICGRDKNKHCKDCAKEYKQHNAEKISAQGKEYYINNLDNIKEWKKDNAEQIAEVLKIYRKVHADEILIKTREWRKENKDILNEKKRIYIAENKEKKRQWDLNYYLIHKEELDAKKKEYLKDHPEVQKRANLKAKTNRGLRVVSWGQEGMREFYRNMPDDMTEDHIIPLQGDFVSGLHVRWNLQYLPLIDNIKKNNKCTPEEATKFYSKILEEIGLK